MGADQVTKLTSDDRRAKLKRLTADDQESMLKSRALPMGFDTTQALHYTPDATPAHAGPSGPSSFFHPMHHEYDMRRSITTGRLRSVSEVAGIASPTSLSSSFEDFYSTPGSLSASETISPTSPFSDRSRLFTPPVSHGGSPHMQASSIRSRPASLALPSRVVMSHTAEQAEHNGSYPANRHHEGPFRHYPQQHYETGGEKSTGANVSQNAPYTTPLSMPYIPVVHGGSQPNLKDSMTGYALYHPSYSMNTAAYTRRASESILAQRQHIVPVRTLQSAPLAAPSQFHPAQYSSSYEDGEAGPQTNLPYGHISQPYDPWQNSQSTTPFQSGNTPYIYPPHDQQYKDLTGAPL